MNLFHQLYGRKLQFAADVLAALDGAPEHRLPLSKAYALGRRYGMDSLLCDDVLLVMKKEDCLHISGRELCWTDDCIRLAPFTTAALEEDYFQQMLRLPSAKLFLSDDLRNRLERPWEEDPADEVRVIGPLHEEPTPQKSHRELRCILDAIEGSYAIRYTYITQTSSCPTQGFAVPWRLEYSAYDNRWWVILYDLAGGRRCVKAWLSNLSDIRPEPKVTASKEEILEARQALLMPEPIVLRVENSRNALERCFMVMERQEFLRSELHPDGSATLAFRYYRFDTKDILRQLLYLGPKVILEGPDSLRAALLEQVEKALDNFL